MPLSEIPKQLTDNSEEKIIANSKKLLIESLK